MASVLELENIVKAHRGPDGPVDILRGVSLAVRAGCSVALTGESGSGKSTLLHLCAGLELPDSGSITVGGLQLTGLSDKETAGLRRDKIGLIFQQFNLVPSLTVAQNLCLQARLSNKYDAALISRLAQHLGLENLMNRYPEQLSGGQQQRVAIGRALAARPDLVLADEPTGNLDEATGDAVLELMLGLCAGQNTALLLVTHSTRLAARLDAHVHLRSGLIEVLR